jgi:hypothetical protein
MMTVIPVVGVCCCPTLALLRQEDEAAASQHLLPGVLDRLVPLVSIIKACAVCVVSACA